MQYFCFEKYIKLHVFNDDSGIALYNTHAGDTFFLKSGSPEPSRLSHLRHQTHFSIVTLSESLGIAASEVTSVVEFLLLNKLVAYADEI